MSALGECLATPHEFIHRGKAYKVSLITQAVKAAFEKRLFAKAKEAAATDRSLMTAEEFTSKLEQMNNDYLNGDYAIESARGQKALQALPGMRYLCSLLFGCTEGEMEGLILQKQEDVINLIQLIIKESFPDAEDGDGGPNA